MTLKTNKIFPRNGQVSGAQGGIIQVVSSTKSDQETNSTAAATWWKTGATCAITPQSASNKILIFGHVSGGVTGPQYNIGVGIYRTNTLIGLGDAASNRARHHTTMEHNTHNDAMVSCSFNYLDSPATTSATTYAVGLWNPSSITRVIYLNSSVTDTDSAYYPRGTTTITLMEISG